MLMLDNIFGFVICTHQKSIITASKARGSKTENAVNCFKFRGNCVSGINIRLFTSKIEN